VFEVDIVKRRTRDTNRHRFDAGAIERGKYTRSGRGAMLGAGPDAGPFEGDFGDPVDSGQSRMHARFVLYLREFDVYRVAAQLAFKPFGSTFGN
jgi:hypothetical protein